MAENPDNSFDDMRTALINGLNMEGGCEIEARNAINQILATKDGIAVKRDGLKVFTISLASIRGLDQTIGLLEADEMYDLEICSDFTKIRDLLNEGIEDKKELLAILAPGI